MDIGPRPPPEIERLKLKIMEYINSKEPHIQENYSVKISQFSNRILEILVKDTPKYEILENLEEDKLSNELIEILEKAIAKAKANYEKTGKFWDI